MKSRSRRRGGRRDYDDAPVGLALISPEGRFLQVNTRLCALLGYTRRQLLHSTLGAVTDPHDRGLMEADSRRLLAGEVDEIRLEQHFLRADGRAAPGWISASVATGARQGSFACVLGVDDPGDHRPPGELKTVDEIHPILDDFVDAVMAADEKGLIASFNQAAQRLFGYKADEVLGREAKLIIADPYQEMFADYLAAWVASGRETAPTSGSREMWGRRKDGSTFPIEFRATWMFLGGDRRIVGVVRDISEQKAQTEALEYKTLHDVLTSLPNRTLLFDRLHQAILAASRQGRPAALLVMDVNGFKQVNDAYGHHVGDQLLQQIALRLEGLLRSSDTVARLGGDEFAILPAIGVGGEDGATTAKKILRVLAQPFIIEDRDIRIAASIGIAVYPVDGQDPPTLMRHADAAMYAAKRARCGYARHGDRRDGQSSFLVDVVGDLRHAIAHEELVLHFQPKIDLRIGRTIGVEALVRWQHPKLGLVPPRQFIPVAEATGLIKPLTRWVLDRALQQRRVWLDAGIDIDVAVNFSARTLLDPDLPATARDLLDAWRVDPASLKVDIPESSFMVAPVIEAATHLGSMGIGLAIDDFGTGFSSLAQLSRLPIREIKIDRSFIAVPQGQEHDAVLRPIVDLGHTMGLKVVAEGVEDQRTLARVLALGCDLAQGFHVCSPAVAAELTPWLRHSAWGVGAGTPPRRTQ